MYTGVPSTGEREKLTGSVLMQAQAAMGRGTGQTDPPWKPYVGIHSTQYPILVTKLDDHIVRVFGFVAYGIVDNR